MESTYVKIVDVIRPAIVPRILPDWVGYEAITELRHSWQPPAAVKYKHHTTQPHST
jgi:hypothetical protein